MKKITPLLFFLLLLAAPRAIAQNDCVDAIIICGDANLSDLETVGIGVQEIFPSNACASQENNSIWLKIRIKTGGTFGFILTPQSPDLVVDFDFWIYGPNVQCSNMGTAIRCSTTNPLNAALTYNTTGMNDVETDVSEGPGPDGNGFIHWMTVNDNDIYYIAVDRPVGESNFAIAWTGTATFYDPPVVETVANLETCETNDPPHGIANFDLTQNTASAIGSQDTVTASFYADYSNAVSGLNPIQSPENYQNIANPQTVYIRIANTVTGCFDIEPFELRVGPPENPVIGFAYATPVCVGGTNPAPIKSPGFSDSGVFSSSPIGLSIDPQTGNVTLAQSTPGKYTILYTIEPNNPLCFAPQQSQAELEIQNCTIPKGISPIGDGKNDFFDISHFDVKQLSIFNRYGMRVYHKENYKKEWNGVSDKGQELPDATYYYLIELKNGDKKTGWVYVLREH
jgi:gliding motility-associated-like protein